MKHMNHKYFRYRADVVARAQNGYPERAHLLRLSEILRLGFLFVGAALCFLLAATLTYTAATRVGPLDWRPVVFLLITLFAGWVGLRVSWALLVESRRSKQETRVSSVT